MKLFVLRWQIRSPPPETGTDQLDLTDDQCDSSSKHPETPSEIADLMTQLTIAPSSSTPKIAVDPMNFAKSTFEKPKLIPDLSNAIPPEIHQHLSRRGCTPVDPNVVQIGKTRECSAITVKAQRDIKAGEEITISYIGESINRDRDQRRFMLIMN
jgi:hypothetical protein